MIYIKICQDRRGKYKNAPEAPLCLTVTSKNVRAMIPMKVSVKQKLWDAKSQKVIKGLSHK